MTTYNNLSDVGITIADMTTTVKVLSSIPVGDRVNNRYGYIERVSPEEFIVKPKLIPDGGSVDAEALFGSLKRPT